jgi:hypothetical protein
MAAPVLTWLFARSQTPERLDPASLGLEQFPPRGAFVQFSTPASRSCRVSLNRLAEAVAPHREEMMVIEVQAGRGLRSAPTVLYVDGEGVVKRRWTRPPTRSELSYELAVAVSR